MFTRLCSPSVVACLVLLLANAPIEAAEKPFADQLGEAERVLIGTPENAVDAPGGEQFLVEINEVLRGTGRKGMLARIANSGDKKEYPKFEAGKSYVFLLKKNSDGKGWVSVSTAVISVTDEKVEVRVAGELAEELTREKFDTLVAGNDPTKEAVPERKGIAGKWVVILSQQGADFPMWLVDIKGEGPEYKAKLLEASKQMPASTLKESRVTDDEVRLQFRLDEASFDFRGKLANGIVPGTFHVNVAGVIPGRLQPTEESSLEPRFAEPVPAAGRDAFVEAASQEESFGPLLKFVKKFPTSPLALNAYQQLIGQAQQAGYDEEQLRKLGEEYIKTTSYWGPRLELRANIDLGVTLSKTDFLPKLASEYLSTAEKGLNDDVPSFWKRLVLTEKGKRLMADGQEAEGLVVLKQMRSENPYDGEVALLLAQYAEKAQQTDEALSLYGELAVLPGMEQMVMEMLSQGDKKVTREQFPSRIVARLWKEKHGGTEGLSEYLDKLYEERIAAIASGKVETRKADEGTRVVLCELFTGAMCPPCVAADLATSAIEGTFGKSEVIVLRYHQHVPGPDPLANDDSRDRFSKYAGQGTPTMFINGKQFDGAGGFMEQVPDVYRRVKAAVDPYLTEKIALKLDVSAKAAGGKIAISAKASGLKNFSSEARLVVVLAEDKIAFRAPNGIRFHEMVVRALPAGTEGAEPVKGQLAFSGEVDLAKLKSQLSKSLAQIEAKASTEFADKPFDFKALHVVAFLQSDETREILQAVAVPVTGDLSFTEPAKPSIGRPAKAKAPAGSGK